MFERELKLYLVEYLNSDWAENHANRKSISRFVFFLNKGSFNYSSKKQMVVVLSSIEVEYMALSYVIQEATWLQLFLTELRFLQLD